MVNYCLCLWNSEDGKLLFVTVELFRAPQTQTVIYHLQNSTDTYKKYNRQSSRVTNSNSVSSELHKEKQ
jgi:hypothetical protein